MRILSAYLKGTIYMITFNNQAPTLTLANGANIDARLYIMPATNATVNIEPGSSITDNDGNRYTNNRDTTVTLLLGDYNSTSCHPSGVQFFPNFRDDEGDNGTAPLIGLDDSFVAATAA